MPRGLFVRNGNWTPAVATPRFIAGKSLRGIGIGLNKDGVPTGTGARGGWTQSRIAERLDMALYVGEVQGGHAGRHEAIIDAKTWERTSELRAARVARAHTGRHATTHLLGGGLLHCQCGASMYPRTDTRSGRDTYRCRGRDERTSPDCTMPPLPRAYVDGRVRAFLSSEVLSPGLARGELQDEAKCAAREARKAATAAERDAAKQEQRLANLRLEWLDRTITRGEYEEVKAELQTALTEAKRAASEARRTAEAIANPSADLLAAVESIRQAAVAEAKRAEGVAAQRAVLERIFAYFRAITLPLAESRHADAPDGHADGEGFALRPKRGGPAVWVLVVPEFRPEVEARWVGTTPMDPLTELKPRQAQNVRDGLPCLYASGPLYPPPDARPARPAASPFGTSSAVAVARTGTRRRASARPGAPRRRRGRGPSREWARSARRGT
jgi:hypothetical protein